MLKTRDEVIQSLSQVKKKLQSEYKITRLALFGSYARGDQTEESDVDVLVEVDPSIGLEFVTLANQIEKAVGLPTDVVSSRSLKSGYRQMIEEELLDV